MENANLSQEISRLYKDLSDLILARDGEGANLIYQELLRAGRRDMDRRGVILFAQRPRQVYRSKCEVPHRAQLSVWLISLGGG